MSVNLILQVIKEYSLNNISYVSSSLDLSLWWNANSDIFLEKECFNITERSFNPILKYLKYFT